MITCSNDVTELNRLQAYLQCSTVFKKKKKGKFFDESKLLFCKIKVYF